MEKNLKRITHNFLIAKTGGNYNLQAFDLFLDFAKLTRTPPKEKFVIDYLNSKNLNNPLQDVNVFCEFYDYLETQKELPSYKVALLFISLNPPYWQYLKPIIDDCKQFLLPGHQTDIFVWSDMYKYPENSLISVNDNQYMRPNFKPEEVKEVFPAESIEWPFGTLYRYDIFLQQEEKFSEYDFVFYLDVDMRMVNYVGDEILPPITGGSGLMAAQHPMYALKSELWPPYEPNKESTAFFKRPGKIVTSRYGKPQFMPLYFAGGFQGGRTKEFFSAMKVMSKNIESDLVERNYIAVWNDETHWNRFLFDNEPDVVLTPSYIYPDSLHKEYYFPIWGVEYPPKIVTLTKKESLKKLTPEEQARLYGTQQMK